MTGTPSTSPLLIPEPIRLAIREQLRGATEAVRVPNDLSAFSAAQKLFRKLRRVVRGKDEESQASWAVSFNDHPRAVLSGDEDFVLGFFAVQVERQGDVISNRVAPIRLILRGPAASSALLRTRSIPGDLQPFAFELELNRPAFPCRSLSSGDPTTRAPSRVFADVIDDMLDGDAGAPLLFYDFARMRFVSHGPLAGPFPFQAGVSARLIIRA